MLTNPHAMLFEAAFADTAHAAGLFRSTLPEPLRHAIDYDALAREDGSFIDPELADRMSDLLFSARLHGAPVLLYLVLDHQGSDEAALTMQIRDCVMRIGRHYASRSLPVPPVVPLVIRTGGGSPPESRLD